MMSRTFVVAAALACLALLPGLGWANGNDEKPKPAAAPAAGPATPAINCMQCHGSVPKYPILGARLGYDVSVHKTGGNSRYSNGAGCQKCHTNEGFIDFIATGKVDDKAFIAYPSQPGCFTCHAPHERGDLSLRTTDPVTLATGQVVDIGKGNLCANCHQSSAVAAKTVVATPANKVFPFWGAHHGPEADIFVGTNAFQFPGKTYSTSAHSKVVTDSCVQCHLTQPEARYGFSPSVGGHSFNIAGEVHEAPAINAAGCLSCHGDMKQVPGKGIFTIAAKEDYDLDGKVEPFQAEVQGLLDKLVNKNGTGYLQKLPIPMYDAAGNWLMAKADTVRPVNEMAALYDYKMILEDKSLGVHNPIYTVQILYDSIQVLDPKFDVSRRPE